MSQYGRVAAQRRNISWSATSWIIFLNVIFFVIALFLETIYGDKVIDYIALNPQNILHWQYLWTLATHMFMHAGFLHIFVNMIALYSLGTFCERIIGRKRFIWFYLTSGVFAGLLAVIMAGFFGYGFWQNVFGSPDTYMVGASGAIFAVAGIFVTLLPRMKFSIIFLPFFSLPGYIMIPLALVVMWLASIAANLPIGNVAHLGGLLVGVAYGYYLRAKYRNKIMALERLLR